MQKRIRSIGLLAAAAAVWAQQPAPQKVFTLPTPARPGSFLLARSGALAAAICRDQKMRVWALPAATLLQTIDLTGRSIDETAISDDGRWIATADRKGDVTTWDTSTGQPHMQTRLAPYAGAAAFSHDGKFLALAAMGGPVQVFDLAVRRKMFELEQPVGGTNSIAFSFDGAVIATVDGDTVVRIYDARSGKVLARNGDSLNEPLAIDFTADGKQAIIGGGDKVVAFVDTATGKIVRRMDRTAEPPVVLQTSPDGVLLAAVFMKADNMTEPAPIMVWEAASGRKKADWTPPTRPLGGGWTADGRLLVATGTKDAVHIWRILP